MKEIGSTLQNHRKKCKLSQGDVQRKLRFYGYKLGKSAISSWETGMNMPNAEQFLALCELFDIQDINHTFLDDDTPAAASMQTEDPFAGLNEEGRAKAKEYIHLLLKSGEYSETEVPHETETVIRQLRKYDISVSAGTGEFLDSDNYELINAGPDVPASADFAVQLHGDSMEPVYHNGQTVYVKQTNALSDGDIGIFFLDGNAYCKKLHESRESLQLVSLNKKYAPLDITAESNFHVFGLVVG